jgi:membrane protein
MQISPESPAQREAHAAEGDSAVREHRLDRLPFVRRSFEVARRVVVGVFSDGFIHAGNLAYLTLLTLFPFFIVLAALASLFGRDADALRAVASVLVTLPPEVQALLRQPIADVLSARTGGLLWIGALIGLWSVGSFIETIRDILRRAYGTTSTKAFWRYRLTSSAIIVGAVVAMMMSFTLQVFLVAIEQFVYRLLPFADDVVGWIQLGRLVPVLVLFGSIFLIMWLLTPSKYRERRYPKWPGALLVTLWWYGALALLPVVLANFTDYGMTYGSLAGVAVALIFFWVVGLGFTIGAQLNAALSEPPVPRLEAAAEE